VTPRSPTRTVAAFDFDGTLTRRDTLFPFLRRLSGTPALARAMAANGRSISLAAAGRGDRDAAKAALLARLLAGVPLSRVEETAERHADATVPRLRGPVLERLRWHQQQGHEVVIVTASPECAVRPVADRLDVRVVLGTRLEVGPDGLLTGRLLGPNNRCEEKVRRLNEHLQGVACELWAYGDAAGDEALLAAADHAFRVGRAGLVPAR
jgi:phosphatidylglycerophosphatase C